MRRTATSLARYDLDREIAAVDRHGALDSALLQPNGPQVERRRCFGSAGELRVPGLGECIVVKGVHRVLVDTVPLADDFGTRDDRLACAESGGERKIRGEPWARGCRGSADIAGWRRRGAGVLVAHRSRRHEHGAECGDDSEYRGSHESDPGLGKGVCFPQNRAAASPGCRPERLRDEAVDGTCPFGRCLLYTSDAAD